jgi:hypothetical protein
VTRTRAPKPNQHERAGRQGAIDALLQRALRGVLTIPEAAVLADYWRAERQVADKTRRSLGDTTRALQRHREAADAEIRRLEDQIAELAGTGGQETRPQPESLHRYRAWLANEHAKAEDADRKTSVPPELRISPHNGIAAGLAIALHGADHLLRADGHDGGPSVRECAADDRAHWTERQWRGE